MANETEKQAELEKTAAQQTLALEFGLQAGLLDGIKEAAAAAGGRVIEGDGIAALRENPGRSKFEEID